MDFDTIHSLAENEMLPFLDSKVQCPKPKH